MAKGRCRGVAPALAATLLAPSADAQTAIAGVTAEVVAPAEISVAAATQWLLSESPGVLTLRIPGAASTGAVASVADNNGAIPVSASSDGSDALRQLIAQITASAHPGSLGVQTLGVVTSNTINGHGVQIIMVNVAKNSRDGVAIIITFD